jgi:uncharacterized protein YjcR
MTTKEVAEKYGVADITVKKWAEKDGKVKRKLIPRGIMAYDFTESDCKRFEKRPKQGWKKGRTRKTE